MKLGEELKDNGFNGENYLIQILDTADKGTLNSLRKKYNGYKEELKCTKGIVVYLLYADGVKRVCEKPCYSQFNLEAGFGEELLEL